MTGPPGAPGLVFQSNWPSGESTKRMNRSASSGCGAPLTMAMGSGLIMVAFSGSTYPMRSPPTASACERPKKSMAMPAAASPCETMIGTTEEESVNSRALAAIWRIRPMPSAQPESSGSPRAAASAIARSTMTM